MIKERKLFKIALSLVAAGAVLLGCGYIFGGYKNVYGNSNGFTINESKEMVNEKHSLDNFKNIRLDVDYGDVEIEKGSEYAIETIYNKSLDDISYDTSDDTLSIEGHRKNKVLFNINCSDDNNENSSTKIKIYVPDGTEISEIKSQMSCGDMSIKGLIIKNGTIKCDYGDTVLNDIECSNMNICNKCGDIDLNNIKGNSVITTSEYGNIKISHLDAGNFSCDLKSGDLDFSNLKFESAIVSNSYGDIEGKNINGNGLKLTSKCGDIDISGDVKGENTIDSEFGSVKLQTLLSQEEYSYDFDAKFGECRVNGKKQNAQCTKTDESSNNKISAACKSGDIEIDFAK
ncbi:DUF4097 family beta strand repeat-containing protein [uncultured Clostridium sp.]|uniref:DUF4097 family beta strand repeat-containing protein n=1 Tax=uncultured Clostridium sp. TaxID=59620 RepID=UPI0025D67683|nr:DUF4097 family beta strand repeat-containing protein [uncultured Clostridium sp.]